MLVLYFTYILKHWTVDRFGNTKQYTKMESCFILTLDNFLQNSFNIFFEFCVRYVTCLISLVALILQNPR